MNKSKGKATLNKLSKLYFKAKGHMFRLTKDEIYRKDYVDTLEELGDMFLELIDTEFKSSDIPNPFTTHAFAHQLFSEIHAIRGKYKHEEEHMNMIESYLGTIHSYIANNGNLVQFYISRDIRKEAIVIMYGIH